MSKFDSNVLQSPIKLDRARSWELVYILYDRMYNPMSKLAHTKLELVRAGLLSYTQLAPSDDQKYAST